MAIDNFDVYEFEDTKEARAFNAAASTMCRELCKKGLNTFEVSGVLQKQTSLAMYEAETDKSFEYDEKANDYTSEYYLNTALSNYIRDSVECITKEELYRRIIVKANFYIEEEMKVRNSK